MRTLIPMLGPSRRALGIVWLTLGVALYSSNAFAQAATLREAVREHHHEFLPPGDGPFPTIIAIPGCSGIAFEDADREVTHPNLAEDDRLFRGHYPEMSERLSAAGYAVLLINIHRAEGVVTACEGEITAERIAEYIDEAVAWARERPFVDQSRIHVLGWSMGGWGTLAWLHGPRSEQDSVRSAVAVYPGCFDREPLTISVPLLMLLGEADDVARPAVCEELVAKSPRADATVESYPGARHGWDIRGAPEALDIGGGMTVGYQAAAAQASYQRILSFLSESE